ncbi:hypothetical protein SCOCK_540033 [Actinacidiphila cocklensis]|uniref:Uncharacterized protein n=1 Tax=Actinacidiphila cocklensis TaxID=887465 RepID=A0A9W4DW24_9ACTN|nr:hypothetical protein SCOCK_540033 [Actinacidiphila cocklensis]
MIKPFPSPQDAERPGQPLGANNSFPSLQSRVRRFVLPGNMNGSGFSGGSIL